MHVNREEVEVPLPRFMGKHCAMFIVRFDTLMQWLFHSWNSGPDYVYQLGVVRFCTSVAWDAKQVSVQPPVLEFLNPNYAVETVDITEDIRVVTVLLEDLHEPCRSWDALRGMIKQLQPLVPPALCVGAVQIPACPNEGFMRRC